MESLFENLYEKYLNLYESPLSQVPRPTEEIDPATGKPKVQAPPPAGTPASGNTPAQAPANFGQKAVQGVANVAKGVANVVKTADNVFGKVWDSNVGKALRGESLKTDQNFKNSFSDPNMYNTVLSLSQDQSPEGQTAFKKIMELEYNRNQNLQNYFNSKTQQNPAQPAPATNSYEKQQVT